MAQLAQFNLQIDKVLLGKAKALAARLEVPLGVLIAQQVANLVSSADRSEALGNRNYLLLVDCALGRLGTDDLMEQLGLDHEADLDRLFQAAGLPKPRLVDNDIQQMVDSMQRLMAELSA